MNRIIDVAPLPDYRLLLTFANGEKKIYDMKPYIDTNAYRELKDVAFFNKAHIVFNYTVGWNDEIDICPDSAYQDSIAYDD